MLNNFEYKDALIVCDIQQEYNNAFSNNYIVKVLQKIIQYQKENKPVFMFWNGPELAMSTELEYKSWLIENIVENNLFDFDYTNDNSLYFEDIYIENLMNHITFIPKSYGSLRCVIDEDYDKHSILYLLQYMFKSGEYDFRDLKLNDLIFDFNFGIDSRTFIEMLQHINDCGEIFGFDSTIYDELIKFDYEYVYTFIGGGEYECLYELMLQFEALGHQCKKLEELVY